MIIQELIGKTLVKYDKTEDTLTLTFSDGDRYRMYHDQDCCEAVYIEDIAGDLDDLLNSPLTMADEATSNENPEGITMDCQESFTWTFYKFATIKGYVTIRWYGDSNGYYSEAVTLCKL